VTARCWPVALLLIGASAPFAAAQTPTPSVYVFPMFVDGTGGGQTYRSILRIIRTTGTGPLQCSVTQRNTSATFVGVNGNVYTADVLDAGASPPAVSTVTLDPFLPWEILRTGGQSALRTGYTKLSCPGPVETQLQFAQSDAQDNKTGEATIGPAAAGASFQFFIDRRDGTRLGFSLANDSTNFVQFAAIARDQFGYEVAQIYDTIEGFSQLSRFVDEMLALPSDFVGSVELAAPGGGSLYAVGLQYTGFVFTTIQPIVRSAPVSN
jgi:hypothetical protein